MNHKNRVLNTVSKNKVGFWKADCSIYRVGQHCSSALGCSITNGTSLGTPNTHGINRAVSCGAARNALPLLGCRNNKQEEPISMSTLQSLSNRYKNKPQQFYRKIHILQNSICITTDKSPSYSCHWQDLRIYFSCVFKMDDSINCQLRCVWITHTTVNYIAKLSMKVIKLYVK